MQATKAPSFSSQESTFFFSFLFLFSIKKNSSDKVNQVERPTNGDQADSSQTEIRSIEKEDDADDDAKETQRTQNHYQSLESVAVFSKLLKRDRFIEFQEWSQYQLAENLDQDFHAFILTDP